MNVKVILTDEVRGLGHRGDEVAVKAGYARNFLYPQGLAYEATEGNLRRLSEEKKKYDTKMVHEKGLAQEVARKMEGLTVVVRKKAGEGNAIYGSVTASEIADALAERGIEVDRRRVELDQPIKRLGSHAVRVHLYGDVVGELTIDVQPLEPVAT